MQEIIIGPHLPQRSGELRRPLRRLHQIQPGGEALRQIIDGGHRQREERGRKGELHRGRAATVEPEPPEQLRRPRFGHGDHPTSLTAVPVNDWAPDPAGQTLVMALLPDQVIRRATSWKQLVLSPVVPVNSTSWLAT